MATIIRTPMEKNCRRKRRRSLFLVCAVFALAGNPLGGQVNAFGVSKTIGPTSPSTKSSWLCMKHETSSHRNLQNSRTIHGTSSSELIARKAALVDTSHYTETNSRSSSGIRDRVNRFLLSKKKKSKVVEEVKDIDSVLSILGEGRKEAVYTAVIFHAPYCRACKASMPLFEELARQYNKKNKKFIRQQHGRSWLAARSEQQSSSLQAKSDHPRKQPVVKFLSVPVTQENSKQLQDQLSVTKFPLAHIYDPVDGLVDERPVLRKLFPGFQERLEAVVVSSSKQPSTAAALAASNATIA